MCILILFFFCSLLFAFPMICYKANEGFYVCLKVFDSPWCRWRQPLPQSCGPTRWPPVRRAWSGILHSSIRGASSRMFSEETKCASSPQKRDDLSTTGEPSGPVRTVPLALEYDVQPSRQEGRRTPPGSGETLGKENKALVPILPAAPWRSKRFLKW